jgi:hypothetical protein
MAWYIDDSCIRIKPGALNSKLDVDDVAQAPFPNTAEARFGIPWKKRNVEFVRFRVGNSVESELWIDGVLVPPADEGPSLSKEPETCKPHAKRSKRRCPGCDEYVCPRCRAVDGVRCSACFDKAGREEQEGRRRGWFIGAAVMLVMALGLFYAGSSGETSLGKFAGAALFGSGFMVYTALRKRRSPDGVAPGALKFEFADPVPKATKRGPEWEQFG